MNLHGIARGAISSVNPQVIGFWKESLGYSTADTGEQIPKYAPPVCVYLQVQPLSTGDIRKLDALNIQGVQKKMYLNGRIDGIVRVLAKGGDLLTLSCGSVSDGVWLVREVMEQWADWCCVGVTLQNGS